jgi:hypothetical protein
MGDYLPTSPATQMSWTADHMWSLCWVCRIMARARIWKLRDRHMGKRHQLPVLTYVPGPSGTAP